MGRWGQKGKLEKRMLSKKKKNIQYTNLIQHTIISIYISHPIKKKKKLTQENGIVVYIYGERGLKKYRINWDRKDWRKEGKKKKKVNIKEDGDENKGLQGQQKEN